MQDHTRTPYHIEAAQYGANLKELKRAHLNSHSEATEIRQVWDYRKAGLKVDQARKLLDWWNRKSYQPEPDYDWAGHYAGRILALGIIKKRAAAMYRQFDPSSIRTLYAGEKLAWNDSQAKIRVAGRIIVVDRYEDTTWPESRSSRQARWPESTRVYYVSRLMREIPPSLHEAVDNPRQNPLDAATERSIQHDCRGNWVARVVDELLGVKGYKLPVRPPALTKVYKIVEQNGCLRSVFAPAITYPLKSWVHDEITGPEHGEGGIYCYRSPSEAIEAARQNDIFGKEWSDGKKLVVTECETKDNISGQRGKICVETLRINKVLHEVACAETQ